MGSATMLNKAHAESSAQLLSTTQERTVIMPKSLDQLLRLKGVIASGEFSSDGKLVDFRSNSNQLSDDAANLTAQFSSANCWAHWPPPIPKSAA